MIPIQKITKTNFLIAIAVQFILLCPLIWIWTTWAKFSPLVIDPSLPLELINLVPAAVQRYGVFMILCAFVFCAFFFFAFKSKDDENNKLNFSAGAQFFSFAFLFCLIGYVMVALRILQFPVCVDDAYIDFRYIYRWANGLGFDYNSPEHVMGFTSHLHVLLLTVIASIVRGVDIALLSQLTNVVFQFATYLLLFLVSRLCYQNIWLAFFSCAAYAFNQENLSACLTGKEAPMLTFLVLLSMWSAMKMKWGWLSWICCLIALTRPEGFIWYAVNLLYFFKRAEDRKQYLKNWIAPSILIVGVYVFLFSYFGSVIPHGALGRAAMFHSFGEATDKTVFFILKFVGVQLFGTSLAAVFAPGLNFEITWLLQGAVAFLFLFEVSRRKAWFQPYVYSSLLLLLFFAVTDPWMFSWYYSWFALLAPLAIPYVVLCLIRLIKSLSGYPSLAFCAVVASLCLLSFNLATLPPARILLLNQKGPFMTFWPVIKTIRSYPFGWSEPQQRLLVYKHAANFFNTPEAAKGDIATWEPGLLAYLLPERKILDLGGLLSDEVLKFYPVPNGERTRKSVWGSIPPEAIIQLKPEWCIFFDCFGDNGLLSNRKFLSSYELQKFMHGNIWGSKGLYIFRRVHDGEVGEGANSNGI